VPNIYRRIRGDFESETLPPIAKCGMFVHGARQGQHDLGPPEWDQHFVGIVSGVFWI
jgi:hypothetical protein